MRPAGLADEEKRASRVRGERRRGEGLTRSGAGREEGEEVRLRRRHGGTAAYGAETPRRQGKGCRGEKPAEPRGPSFASALGDRWAATPTKRRACHAPAPVCACARGRERTAAPTPQLGARRSAR